MSKINRIFAAKIDAKEVIVTALQLNADICRNLAILSEDEYMLNKAAKYLRRLAKQKTDNPTCMTKEEFFARIDEADKGPSRSFASVSELDHYIQTL